MNAEQEKAVTSQAKATLVVAGPGSGKTTVIIQRLIYLIEQRVNPKNILALTFSRPAALEMKTRVAETIPSAYSHLWVDTFHAFSAEVLRQWGDYLGLNPFFEVATQEDSLAILAGILAEPAFIDINVDLEAVLNFISRAKDEAVLDDEYAAYTLKLPSEPKPNQLSPSQLAYVYTTYQKELQRQGLLDFGDLILKTLALLKENNKARHYWQQRFKHILVDEFQDTNYAQGELLKLLKGPETAIFVVGDDDQSIYRFRGASLKNILDFQETFKPTFKVTLNKNYRSGKNIVNASQCLIQSNQERLPKRLVPAFYQKDAVYLIETETKEAQADYVAHQILRLKEEYDWDYKDFALLFTSVRHEAAPFIKRLTEQGIPFTVDSFDNLMAAPVIRQLLSWIKLITNPFSWSALTSILVTFYRFEPEEVAQLNQQRLYGETGIELIKRALANGKNKGDKRLKEFLKTYSYLAKLSHQLTVDRFIAKLMELFKFLSKAVIYSLPEFQLRQLELNYFLTLANRFSCYQPQSSLEDFLSYLKKLPQITVPQNTAEGEDKVSLMTLHAAKGLEFKAVFILNLTKSKMPGRRRAVIYDLQDELLKEKLTTLDVTEQHKSERRRLLYVGMTRAKERLFLLFPQEENKPSQRSPFLDELLATFPLKVEKYKPEAEAKTLTLLPFFPRGATTASLEVLRENFLKDVAQLMQLYQAQLQLNAEEDLKKVKKSSQQLIQELRDDLFKLKWRQKLAALEAEHGEAQKIYLPQTTTASADKLFLNNKHVNLTVSDLSVYLKCPSQFKFKVIYKIPTLTSAAAKFGVLIHRVLQKFHQHSLEKPTSLDFLLSLYEQALATLPAVYYPSQNEVELYREALKAYFKNFINQDGDCFLIEQAFELSLNGHIISGRVDRVDKLKNGSYELIDYKTGSSKGKNEVKKEIQLAVYALGAKKNWRLEPERLTYYFIKTGEKVSLSLAEVDLEETEQLITTTLENIASGIFTPKEDYFHCQHCDYELICPKKERRLR